MKIDCFFVILVLMLSLVSADEVTAPSVVSISVSYTSNSATLSVTTDEDSTCKYSKQNEDYSSMNNMQTTGNTDHSTTETFSESESGNYYILCQDEFGNLMDNPATTNYNIVISPPEPAEEIVEEQEEVAEPEPAAPPAPSQSQQSQSQGSTSQSTSKSSGSSQKSGLARNLGTTTFQIASMKKGEMKEVNLDKKTVPINKISFAAKKNVDGAKSLTVKRIYDLPKSVYKIPDAHSFMEINVQNMNQADFERYVITFSIENTWMISNKLKPNQIISNQISLYRYNSGQWTEYFASEVKSLENYKTSFTANIPGFSYFAIAKSGLDLPKVEEIIQEEVKVPEPSPELVEETTEDLDEEMEEVEETVAETKELNLQTDTSSPRTLLYIGLALILLIVTGGFIWYKRK